MYEWVIPVVMVIATGIMMVLKGIYGTDKPQRTTVEHAAQSIEITDGKSDSQRIADLGL